MSDSEQVADQVASYALGEATDSLKMYSKYASRNRWLYWCSEMSVAVASAAIAATVAVWPDEPGIAAVLGALVAAITSAKAIFHWHENYIRFSASREAVNGELRLYKLGVDRYADSAKRDAALVKQVSAIEKAEFAAWTKVAELPAP